MTIQRWSPEDLRPLTSAERILGVRRLICPNMVPLPLPFRRVQALLGTEKALLLAREWRRSHRNPN